MMLPDTVKEYTQFAAQEFLQTVVFIDDRIFDTKDGAVSEPRKLPVPRQRKKVAKSAEQKASESVAPEESEDWGEYSPHEVVTSFAKRQIICSLYQPGKKAKVSPTSDLFPLCLAADIVIVDWDLYGDKGRRALELIDRLIQQAVRDVPEQLRLVLVYTQEIDLFEIAEEVFQRVSLSVGDELNPLQEEGGLAFHTLNSRVSILGKAGRTRPKEYLNHVVEEKELADVAVREFAKLASGLLHAATLLGLAQIRKNSRKVLSNFNSKLDPAFLTHMAMCRPETDASTHIVPLLISEIEAVLEDQLPRPLISNELIKDWCQNIWQPGEHLDELLGAKGLDVRAMAEGICLKGFKDANKEHTQIPNPNNNKKIRKAARMLLSADDAKSNHLFSHLMASRTFYGSGPRTLRLGSVVCSKRDNRYLLCIQPLCDSVRLDVDRVFVFVELTEADPNSGNQATHVIVKEDSATIELFYRAKVFQSYVAEFSPDPVARQVLTKVSKKGEGLFVDKSGKKYIWMDQLKTSHAQRAVAMFASEVSRVGLTESEWLRMLGKK